ncbi:MAG: hypothetical protein L3J82_10775, partial [Planctomycetes bacterium]|nr:hypothetical protein [Planctomycetota bacterium]
PVALFTCPQLYDEYLTEVTGRRKALIESVRDIVFAAPKKSVKLTTQITRKILGEKPAMPDQPTESRN